MTHRVWYSWELSPKLGLRKLISYNPRRTLAVYPSEQGLTVYQELLFCSHTPHACTHAPLLPTLKQVGPCFQGYISGLVPCFTFLIK